MTIQSNKRTDSMWAMVLNGHGGFEQLEYCQVPIPEPSDDEVLIKVGACGLNNTDINTRTAWYSNSVAESVGEGGVSGFDHADNTDASWGGAPIKFPRIQGADVVGEIIQVGTGINSSRVGDRVIIDPWLLTNNNWQDLQTARYVGSEINGGFAEYMTVQAGNAIAIESSLSDAELATFPCAYTTALNMFTRTQPMAGETVVISGASGGVGSAVIQLCRLKGCHVIAIASDSKTDLLKELGAAQVIDRNHADLTAAIKQYANGAVDIVLDVVGGAMFMPLISALRQGGRYSSCGCIAGSTSEIDLRTLVYRDLQLTGATICPPGTMQQVVSYIETDELKPLLAKTFPLSELVAAQTMFMQKSFVGNIVVRPN